MNVREGDNRKGRPGHDSWREVTVCFVWRRGKEMKARGMRKCRERKRGESERVGLLLGD